MTPYATREQLRSFRRIDDPTDTGDDDLLDLCLVAARSAIDRATGRVFEPAGAVTDRVFRSRIDPDTARTVIDIDDTFEDADGIDLAYDPLQEGDFATPIVGAFRPWPFDAAARERPYTRLVMARATAVPIGEVQVTTAYGWDPTPDTIVVANLLQAARYLKRRDAPFGVAGSPDLGNELRLLSKLDPDVEVMVGDYRRWF